MGKGEERRVGVVCWVVSWRFESDQPLRFISGLETNFNPSVSYSAYKSLNVYHNISPAQLKYFNKILQKLSVKTVHTKCTTAYIYYFIEHNYFFQ